MTETRTKDAHIWQRDALDWYQEPSRCTEQLLSVETFSGNIWDPACGGGNIIKACLARGLDAYGSDIVDRGFGGVQDFLDPVFDFVNVDNIICNPPFFRAKGTEDFIRKALTVATRKVAIFTDIKFLAGQARGSGLWADLPPSRAWILSERPSCPPGEYLAAGNEAKGGTADWVWLVWSASAPRGETKLGWIAKGRARAEVAKTPAATSSMLQETA